MDRGQRPQHLAPTGAANDSRMARERLDTHETHRASGRHWQCRGPALLRRSKLDYWAASHRRWWLLADGSRSAACPAARLITRRSSFFPCKPPTNNRKRLPSAFALLPPRALSSLIFRNFGDVRHINAPPSGAISSGDVEVFHVFGQG